VNTRTPGGNMINLAAGINNSGVVTGYAQLPDNTIEAYRTGPDGTPVQPLNSLGGPITAGTAADSVGRVVGYAFTRGGVSTRAFINSYGKHVDSSVGVRWASCPVRLMR
jgi:hypothetical protein